MRRGMPLVCFEGASGVAEVLAEQPGCRELVVPYVAIDLAAARILELGENPAYRRQMSAAIKAFAAQAFDMDSYTDRLDEFGRGAAAIKQSRIGGRCHNRRRLLVRRRVLQLCGRPAPTEGCGHIDIRTPPRQRHARPATLPASFIRASTPSGIRS